METLTTRTLRTNADFPSDISSVEEWAPLDPRFIFYPGGRLARQVRVVSVPIDITEEVGSGKFATIRNRD